MEANKIILNGSTLIDLTEDTALASDVVEGKTFHTADGVQREGTLTLPSGTLNISSNGVYNVTNYASADVQVSSGGGGSDRLPDYIQGNISSLYSTDFGDMEFIPQYKFAGESVTTVELPYSVSGIGGYAFRDSQINYIEGPGVSTIGDYCFSDCYNLGMIAESMFPMLDTIGSRAFQNCESLDTVSLPETVTSIGKGAFRGCPHLQTFSIAAINPPILVGDIFDSYPQVIEVPVDSLSDYQGAQYWSNYSSIMVGV